jgi:hypothetical protein
MKNQNPVQRRLNALNEFYDDISRGWNPNPKDIIKKNHINGGFFRFVKDAGIIKKTEQNGIVRWEWVSTIRPNLHMASRLFNDEKAYLASMSKDVAKREVTLLSEGEKKCSICGKIKNISEFHADKTKKDGLRSACRDCVNEVRSKKIKSKKRESPVSIQPVYIEKQHVKHTKKYGIIRRFLRWIWVFILIVNI